MRERVTWKNSRDGLLFAGPWIVGYLLLFAIPLVMSILLSFTEWDGVDFEKARWVGLDNYSTAFDDPLMRIALGNTCYYSFIYVPMHLSIALGLAMLLNHSLRGMSIFRTIYYLPHFLAGVATMVLWLWLLHPEIGMINEIIRSVYDLLASLGLEQARDWPVPRWLHDPQWSKPALILMGVWSGGAAMLIFLAALQTMPQQLYEAAAIDGAGAVRQFWHVTMPMLTPAILFNLVLGIIGSFQVFMQSYIMTGGGPDNSTLFYMLYLYQMAFEEFHFGYASALAWILFSVIMALTAVVFLTGRKWVHYR